jgi:hypothetical protein
VSDADADGMTQTGVEEAGKQRTREDREMKIVEEKKVLRETTKTEVGDMTTTARHDDQNGAYRPDGSWIGYDYARQVWIDTATTAERDASYPAGSACNPLTTRD